MGLINTRPYKATGPSGPYGIFVGGTDGTITDNVDRYEFETKAMSQGTALHQADRFNCFGSCGNADFGLIAGGNIGNATYKYTYSGETTSAGSTLSITKITKSGCSSETFGLIAGGFSPTDIIDYYRYNDGAILAYVGLSVAKYGVGSAANTIKAVFASGNLGSSVLTDTVDTFQFAGGARSTTTTFGTAKQFMAVAGNDTLAIFGGGDYISALTNTSRKHTFASGAWGSGTALSLGAVRRLFSGMSNATVGIMGGGLGSTTYAYTDEYIFSNNVVSATTSLSTARYSVGATSPSHGGIPV